MQRGHLISASARTSSKHVFMHECVFRLYLVPPAVCDSTSLMRKAVLCKCTTLKCSHTKCLHTDPTVYIFTEVELHSLPPQFHCVEFVAINILWHKCTFSPNIFANGCLSLLPERLAHFRRTRFAFNIPPQNKQTKM